MSNGDSIDGAAPSCHGLLFASHSVAPTGVYIDGECTSFQRHYGDGCALHIVGQPSADPHAVHALVESLFKGEASRERDSEGSREGWGGIEQPSVDHAARYNVPRLSLGALATVFRTLEAPAQQVRRLPLNPSLV